MSDSCQGDVAPHGRSLAGPRTPDDAGEADPALAAALRRWAGTRDAAGEAEVYAALPAARVLVPVVATLEEAEVDAATGRRAEKASSMSVVTLVAPSGATALPAFLSTGAMRRWRLDARPVPVSGREACLAALDGGHAAVVVDPAGARFAVEGPAMTALAEGWVPAADGGAGAALASRRVGEGLRLSPAAEPLPAEVQQALTTALAAEAVVAEAYLLDAAVGEEAPARTLGLVLARGADAAQLAALAQRLHAALAATGAAGLDLAVLNRAQRAHVGAEVPPLWSAPGPPAPVASEALPAPGPPAGPAAGRRRWWRPRR